jgi:Lhr-like helicase
MLKRVSKRFTKKQIVSMLEPPVAEWFDGKFTNLTEPQGYAVPLIHRRKNVLVSSPTGSGKTLTAFLSIINELARLHRLGKLEDRIYCVYVSPLKALANDINRNLEEPLREIGELAERAGYDMPDIRVAVRTGDTTTSERQKMVRKPPHIFITTPESLAIVLSTKRFSEKFTNVEWVIIDEIHDLCSSKRGVLLSLTLERFPQEYEFTRIGLSATQAPIDDIAGFLAGISPSGKPRTMHIVDVRSKKELDIQVIAPVSDIGAIPLETVNTKMYDLLGDLIGRHRTSLIFTNTRSGTERVAYKLGELGVEDLEPHHGSLSKQKRLSVEEKLKNGKLRGVVTSTSLELGIDIGSIDLVCQLGSPKTVAKALQRFGRSGHAYGGTSKGRFIVLDNNELVECAVIARCALDYRIDRVRIPENSLDVLAQTLVGMALQGRWRVVDAYGLVKRSYCYRNLRMDDFRSVLRYLSGGDKFEGVYAKVWLDPESDIFGIRRSSRLIYFLNAGTIPEESEYQVFSAASGAHVGKLSEKFVERLHNKDVFLLGGKTYEFVQSRGQKALVNDASGRKPTVPSWTGEMLPMSYDLALDIRNFRKTLHEKLKKEKDGTVARWLREKYRLDAGCAASMIRFFRDQLAMARKVPAGNLLLIEGYKDREGNSNAIFHYCFGRRINELLAHSYAFELSGRIGRSFRITVTDECFMLTVPGHVELDGIAALLSPSSLETVFRKALRQTELFKQRFRHCASRGLMVLKNYMGKDVAVSKQKFRAGRILDSIVDNESFPLVRETYDEIMNIDMDIAHAKEVLRDIENGTIKVEVIPYSEIPSPFAHDVVLAGVSDIVMMEDKSGLLKRINRKILERAINVTSAELPKFDAKTVDDYFRRKFGSLEKRDASLKTVIGKWKSGGDAHGDPAPEYIERVLGHIAPATASQLAAISSLTEPDVRKYLRILENEGAVSSGTITVGDDTQYILSKDLVGLDNLGKKVYNRLTVLNYLIRKQFGVLDGIDDYFNIFGETSDPFDIFNHVRKFDNEAWKDMLSSGALVQGRFIRGRVKYVPKGDIQDYVTVYRQEKLDELQKNMLSIISSSPGITLSDLAGQFPGKDIPKDMFKESMNRLDSNLYIVRTFYDSHRWTPQNRYAELKAKPGDDEEAVKKKLVGRFIRAYGPVTASAICAYFGFPYEGIDGFLVSFEKDGTAEKILSMDEGRGISEYYISTSETDKLDAYSRTDAAHRDETVRILSLSDAFAVQCLPMALARYGVGRYYIVMKGTELAGTIELWERSDRIEIKDIRLDTTDDANANLLDKTLDAVDRMMVYYKLQGYETVAVRSVSGKNAGMLDSGTAGLFQSHGYRIIQKDLMVKGDVCVDCFSEDTVLNYILWKQHIHPERQFPSEMDAVREMHGLRSNNELALRLVSENYSHLRLFWRDGKLAHALAIPEYATYCTMDDVLLYKKAKNRELDPNMKLIMNMFDGKPLSKKKMLDDAPLGLGSFQDALRELHDGLYIVRNSKGQYYATGNTPMAQKSARVDVVRNLFMQFGIFSAENLAVYTKFEYKVSELRQLLKELESDGFLSRGYFIDGDDTLFWMVREDLERMRTGWVPKIDGAFVLTPDDRLSHCLAGRIYQKFRKGNCFVIFSDGKMTCAFKGRFGKGELIVQDFECAPSDRQILEMFAYRKGLRIVREEKKEEVDWDLISYVDKTRGADVEEDDE